jgi:hypothetical protein
MATEAARLKRKKLIQGKAKPLLTLTGLLMEGVGPGTWIAESAVTGTFASGSPCAKTYEWLQWVPKKAAAWNPMHPAEVLGLDLSRLLLRRTP